MRPIVFRSSFWMFGLVVLTASAGCGGPEGDERLALETAEGAVVKGGNLPGETCLRRNTDGTTTTGACSVVCKDLVVYEPDTDAEVDAISSNGGVCIQPAKRASLPAPIRVGGVLAR